MSYDLVLGGDVQMDLATTSGWLSVKIWGDTLSEDKYDEILQLTEHGLSQDIPRLTQQLTQAIRDTPPDNEATLHTIEQLIEALGHAPDGAESAFVTDGMGPDDDEPDEWFSSDE